MQITAKHVVGAGAGAGVLTAAAILIAPWEGYYGRTYNDIVGVPTVCYGETDAEPVAEGRIRTFTKAECLQMLADSLPKYYDGMIACMKKPDAVPDSVKVAGTSMTYNIGIRAVCKSTFMREINAENYYNACKAMLKFDMAGGKVIPGLKNRRMSEERKCEEGIL